MKFTKDWPYGAFSFYIRELYMDYYERILI